MGWGISAWRHRLADDNHQVYTHKEMAEYQAFLESVDLSHARELERRAAVGGSDAAVWADEAAEARARASSHAASESEYRWRAELKRRGW
jgi:hypothetical protein